MNPKQIVLVTGQSGCGKGTQVQLLRERYFNHDTFHMASGDLVRNFGLSEGALPGVVKANNAKGKFAPISVMSMLCMNHINENYKGESTILWDGSPRSLLELELLSQFVDFLGIEKFVVVHINLEDDICLKRMIKRSKTVVREETQDERSLANKLDYYRTNTIHAVNAMRGLDNQSLKYATRLPILIDIDGSGGIEEVHEKIITEIKKSL